MTEDGTREPQIATLQIPKTTGHERMERRYPGPADYRRRREREALGPAGRAQGETGRMAKPARRIIAGPSKQCPEPQPHNRR